jgi:hypothetical protein
MSRIASLAEKLLVASTHRSGPAPSGTRSSAIRQSVEPSTFTMAATRAPRSRAAFTESITSMVSPLCESATTSASLPTKSRRYENSEPVAKVTRRPAIRANRY